MLYGKREKLEELDVPKLQPAPDTVPEKLETGTQNHEGIVGTAAAVDYFASLARPAAGSSSSSRRERLRAVFEVLHERGRGLLKRLWEELSEIDGVTLYGPPPSAPRTPTLCLYARAGRPAEEVQPAPRRTSEQSLCLVRSTSLRNDRRRTPSGVGNDGLVRLGCACYTTDEEVARVIDGVRDVARGRCAL